MLVVHNNQHSKTQSKAQLLAQACIYAINPYQKRIYSYGANQAASWFLGYNLIFRIIL